MHELFDTMTKLYEDAETYIKNTRRDGCAINEDLLGCIARQTTECCIFIREYAKPGFGEFSY